MILPEDRWQPSPAGLILPEGYQAETEDRLDDILLRLPCYEPSGFEVSLSARDLLRHVLLVGQTGAGKTTVLNRVWSDLIRYRSAHNGQRVGLLILDSQGDHTVENIRRLAAEAGRADDVRVLSPQEGHFNPLAELTSFAGVDAVTSKIISATHFSDEAKDGDNNAYWTENTRFAIEAGLVYFLIHQPAPRLLEALQFLSDLLLPSDWSPETKQIVERCESIVASTPGLSTGIQAKLILARNTVQSWKRMDSRTRSILQSCVGITFSPFLMTPALRYWDTSKGAAVSPSEALEGKIVVVSTRAATEVETAMLICRLIKMEFYGAAQRRKSLGQNHLAGIVMDEFHYAVTRGSPRWSDISNLATLRGKGVFVLAATQGLIQLDLILGVGATEALLINFSNLILMRSQEMGHLYLLAERLLGYKPARIVPARTEEESGNLLSALPTSHLLIPPQPICPPGALGRLETHQAYVILANGVRTEEPIWLAPLFLQESNAPEIIPVDLDLAALRRAEANRSKPAPPPQTAPIYYSSSTWNVLLHVLPRQQKTFALMTLGEFATSLRGLGHNPQHLGSIPVAWRMACFHLVRRLPSTLRLLHLSARDGQLMLLFIGAGRGMGLEDMARLEARWKRSVYTRWRPWCALVLWQEILTVLSLQAEGRVRFVDGSHVKCHQFALASRMTTGAFRQMA